MLIDTHAHIYLDRFDDDFPFMLERAWEVGVKAILMPAIDIPSIHLALELCSRFAGLYAMAALHPSETKNATDADFDEVASLVAEPRVVAVGETGLDYYWDRGFDEKQQEMLRRHIRLAVDKDLPLVFHNREASEDLVRILKEEKAASENPERLRGVFHCFGGPAWLGDEVIGLGFHVGIGGTLTFKNAGVPGEIEGISMDRIVLETDAPFLAPMPHRGKRNEPAYVRIVAEKLAETRGLSLLEVARATTENACRLFGIQVD